MQIAPYGPRRPLKPKIVAAPIVLGATGVVFAVVSMFSMWTLDERADAVITPEIQAQLDEVQRQAEAGEIDQGFAGTEILRIRSQASAADRIVVDGKSSDGPGLGTWTLIFSVAGAVAAAAAAGVLGLGDRRQWIGGALAMGFGTGVLLIAVGWVGSLARATDPNFSSGVGAMIGGIAGFMLIAAGNTVIAGFERSHVYRELVLDTDSNAPSTADPAGSDSEVLATVAT
jgi:hypothetical protein